MLKTVAAGMTALFVTASSLAYAQAPSATTTTGGEQENARPSAADLNALTDARIGIVKAALQLTPEQAKYWPAVEEAIRNRSMGRQTRLAALARQREQGDLDPIDSVRHRADALAQRARSSNNLPTHGSRFTPPSPPTRSSGCASSRYMFFAWCRRP